MSDHVVTYDPTTGKAGTQTVQATSVHHDIALVDVTLRVTSGPSGTSTESRNTPAKQQTAVPATKEETIATTRNHPWLTADAGWMWAGWLRVGEPVRLLDGRTAEVVALADVAGADMWDLTVSQVHTFAVGAGEFVVHNSSTLCRVTSRIKDDQRLVKAAEKAGKDSQVQKEMDTLVQRYREGNVNPGIGTKALFGNGRYLRGRAGARVFYRMLEDNTMEILGKASKANEDEVIDIITKRYFR